MHKQLKRAFNKRNFFLYVCIVLLPLALLSPFYLDYKSKQVHAELEAEARSHSSFQALYIESFISETIGRLESMAVLMSDQGDNLSLIEQVLYKTHTKDARFSGFYWLNTEGDIIVSSNVLTDKVNLIDRPYVQEAIQTGKTRISEAHFGRVTGRYIFSLATPVRNHFGELSGILIGSVQLNEMENVINDLSNGEFVQLIDDNNQILVQSEDLVPEAKSAASYMKLEVVPWKVKSVVSFDYAGLVMIPFLFHLLTAFVVATILFMLIQSYRSKQKLAQELKQNEAEKLKLIGTIAASTAHEIRNPLTGIKGFISLLSAKYKDSKDQYYFSLIQNEVDRINTIVSELLIVGKPTVIIEETNDLNEILKEIIPLIESEAHMYNVQLSFQMTEESVWVKVSKDHFKQIVLNLVKNALEAMDSGGQLHLASEAVEGTALLLVRDTGKGMPPEVLDKILTPFFTMKKSGTGLGLAVCKRILDSYGGSMRIESEVGAGTQITIEVPLAGKSEVTFGSSVS
ncbi:ATP-binding protein [Paenibacillus sp. NPDC056579]|uniref:ATP-binding protein n=1 Tax=Paenibacillus sp. NPDC056579 TaxID=3345871 RepID=UPI0036BDE289